MADPFGDYSPDATIADSVAEDDLINGVSQAELEDTLESEWWHANNDPTLDEYWKDSDVPWIPESEYEGDDTPEYSPMVHDEDSEV